MCTRYLSRSEDLNKLEKLSHLYRSFACLLNCDNFWTFEKFLAGAKITLFCHAVQVQTSEAWIRFWVPISGWYLYILSQGLFIYFPTFIHFPCAWRTRVIGCSGTLSNMFIRVYTDVAHAFYILLMNEIYHLPSYNVLFSLIFKNIL